MAYGDGDVHRVRDQCSSLTLRCIRLGLKATVVCQLLNVDAEVVLADDA